MKNYKKSNDEKYLTEIKNTTGSSLGDESLQNLASKKKTDFINELKDLFIEKQKSRIEILGKEQNSSLEKKIFLQIIDFFLAISFTIFGTIKTSNWFKTIWSKRSFDRI